TLGPLGIREKAFRKTVARYAPEVKWTRAADIDGLDGGRRAAREIIDSGFEPTAIICVNDFMAVGVLRELRERGLRVPQDVSVTGFDNIRLAEFASPPLTTVHIPREQIGHIMFKNLVADPKKPNSAGREVVIDPEFMVRESTGRAPER